MPMLVNRRHMLAGSAAAFAVIGGVPVMLHAEAASDGFTVLKIQKVPRSNFNSSIAFTCMLYVKY